MSDIEAIITRVDGPDLDFLERVAATLREDGRRKAGHHIQWAVNEIRRLTDTLASRTIERDAAEALAAPGKHPHLGLPELRFLAGIKEREASEIARTILALRANLAAAERTAQDWAERATLLERELAAAKVKLADREWQPIETAPKDGTVIDLWLGRDSEPHRRTDVYWGRPHHSCGEYGQYCDSCPPDHDIWCDPFTGGYELDLDPTHWMRPAAAPVSP